MRLTNRTALFFALTFATLLVFHAESFARERIFFGQRVYSAPVQGPVYYQSTPVQSSPARVVTSVNPIEACCGGSNTSDCTCKDLGSCFLKLSPPNCKLSGQTTKTPILFEIVGKIPKQDTHVNCYTLVKEFAYVTKVPTIECKTEECVEIGTKKIECEVDGCKPGCWFRVCIPVNKCYTKTVECKLVDQDMPHKVFLRSDPKRGDVYDVYVINNADPSSPRHAGGMPKEWLVMHCASKAEVQSRFPNMLASNQGKNVKPQATDADVAVELRLSKEMIEKALKGAKGDQTEVDGKKTDSETTALAENALAAIEAARTKVK